MYKLLATASVAAVPMLNIELLGESLAFAEKHATKIAAALAVAGYDKFVITKDGIVIEAL